MQKLCVYHRPLINTRQHDSLCAVSLSLLCCLSLCLLLCVSLLSVCCVAVSVSLSAVLLLCVSVSATRLKALFPLLFNSFLQRASNSFFGTGVFSSHSIICREMCRPVPLYCLFMTFYLFVTFYLFMTFFLSASDRSRYHEKSNIYKYSKYIE